MTTVPLLFLGITALLPPETSYDWYALLQTEHTWRCSADYLISDNMSQMQVLSNSLPFAAAASIPSGLPWAEGRITDPLESGIWGGGRWCESFMDGDTQDTLSYSRIGLIQNTLDHSRYSFELDRPLPWGTSGNFEMRRDDTLSLHSALVNGRQFSFRVAGWEGSDYGWGTWAGWNGSDYYARAGFSRLQPGDRRPELLGGIRTALGNVMVEAGGAGALSDSTDDYDYRYAAGATLSAGDFSFSGFADNQNGETGFWGGILWKPESGLTVSSAWSTPGGDDDFQTISLRHNHWTVLARLHHQPAAAADYQVDWGLFRGKAAGCWYFDSDSLRMSCHGLFGYDWYRGRLEAGPRFTGTMNSSEEWLGKVDAVLGFTLLPFSIAAALEDIGSSTDQSWSFGITWSFTDQPPQLPEGEGDGRGER